MTRLAGALLAVTLVVAGCGGNPSDPDPADPTASATPDSPAASDAPKSSEDLTIDYGQLGPVKVGMTEDDAAATGLFDADNPAPVEGCPEPTLAWKKAFTGVDVVPHDGRIVSLGVRGTGPRTESDVGVGSTLADLEDAYPDLKGPETAGYLQSGAWAQSGNRWIGFLFGESPGGNVDDGDKITFIEVTKGKKKPDLMRDGC